MLLGDLPRANPALHGEAASLAESSVTATCTLATIEVFMRTAVKRKKVDNLYQSVQPSIRSWKHA